MHNEQAKNARFLRLYTKVQAKLYSYILAVVHNRSDAEELFQETAVILWDSFDKYDEQYSFNAWAIGIAKNKIFEYLRENKKTKKIFSDVVYKELANIAEQDTEDITERLENVKHCFGKLNMSDRKLLMAKFFQDNSVRQISQLTGRSTNSLYKSFTRIIVQLRKCITHQRLSGEHNA